MKTELERKALRYRDLARYAMDDEAYTEIIQLAAECEMAAANSRITGNTTRRIAQERVTSAQLAGEAGRADAATLHQA